jgi:hypothetical protein
MAVGYIFKMTAPIFSFVKTCFMNLVFTKDKIEVNLDFIKK